MREHWETMELHSEVLGSKHFPGGAGNQISCQPATLVSYRATSPHRCREQFPMDLWAFLPWGVTEKRKYLGKLLSSESTELIPRPHFSHHFPFLPSTIHSTTPFALSSCLGRSWCLTWWCNPNLYSWGVWTLDIQTLLRLGGCTSIHTVKSGQGVQEVPTWTQVSHTFLLAPLVWKQPSSSWWPGSVRPAGTATPLLPAAPRTQFPSVLSVALPYRSLEHLWCPWKECVLFRDQKLQLFGADLQGKAAQNSTVGPSESR